jgi:hypothetical protein
LGEIHSMIRHCKLAVRACKSSYQNVIIDPFKLSDPYVTGLFMAEGTVGLYKSHDWFDLHSGITQRSCRRLLYAIKEKIGLGGHIDCKQLHFGPKDSVALFRRMLPYLPACQKRPQVELALHLQDNVRRRDARKRSQQEIEIVENIAKELKRLKKL